ncbi:hypothetical protein QBC36DRAFT_337858 [Triangularia setosa]|uniref:Uncharacterized protein n=1 Tax=Triangularia setosa TaxID=2587417 RepID=A0AAN7A396_9PEZI|nr:hypothetical protein QBC36DRAFT_337858 [Podospora setosa]
MVHGMVQVTMVSRFYMISWERLLQHFFELISGHSIIGLGLVGVWYLQIGNSRQWRWQGNGMHTRLWCFWGWTLGGLFDGVSVS